MRFELNKELWADAFEEAQYPIKARSAPLAAEIDDPFMREDVSLIIDISEPEIDDSPDYFIVGQLLDQRYFFIQGPLSPKCRTSKSLAELFRFGMTDTAKTFLPKVSALLNRDLDLSWKPSKVELYFATELDAMAFEDFWRRSGHAQFKRFVDGFGDDDFDDDDEE